MNVIRLDIRPSTPESIREAFGRKAYSGELPRSQWIPAQRLLERFDATRDADEMARIAGEMTAMTDGAQSPRSAA